MLSTKFKERLQEKFPLRLIEILGGLVIFFIFYNLLFWGRIYPNVYVANIDIGGKTPNEATSLLEEKINYPEKIEVVSENETFSLDLTELSFSYNYSETSLVSFSHFHTKNIFVDLKRQVLAPFKKTIFRLDFVLNDEALNEKLSIIAGQTLTEAIEPSATLSGGEVVIEKGKKGYRLDKEKLRKDIDDIFGFAKSEPVQFATEEIDPTLSDEEVEVFRKRSETFLGKSLVLNFENQKFTYSTASLLPLLDPRGEYKEDQIRALIIEVTGAVNRDPQNPVFVIEGGWVKEFAPAKEGAKVKDDTLRDMILGNLRTLEATEEKTASLDIPVQTTASEIKTEEVNNLGINTLIGRGTSQYRGSIASRVHNIGVAASRFRGALVKPGEVFSFNQVLGDVSEYTGYKQAYIIKDGQTVLGDGGGVCQVSTTLFRAILDAGLPIVERRAHSYRVGYYEQDSGPGLDATVYFPTTDLKFKNDTPGHLLIQSYYNPTAATLEFEIYGTDDGRVASIAKPVTTQSMAPAEDLYVDDPTLPAGTIRQIEYKAWGARVYFNYSVVRDGEIIYEKTFSSNYQPWQAKFLRGTGPVN